MDSIYSESAPGWGKAGKKRGPQPQSLATDQC